MLKFGVLASSVVGAIALNVLMLWLVCSAIASTVKVVTQKCGTRLNVEQALAADWFCPAVSP